MTSEYRSRYNWVTDAGDYLGRSTVIKYGGKSKESLIGRRDQLSKLEIEIESTAEKLEQIKKNIQNYKTRADAVRTSLEQKITQLDKSVADSVQLEKKLAQHRYSCQHQKERLNENDEVIAENIRAVKVLGIRQTKLDEALNELKTEYKSIQAEIAEMSVALETINKERNKKQQGKQDSRVKLVEIEKEFEGLEYRLEASTSQLVELDNRKKQIMSASERLGEKVLGLERSIAENSEVKEDLIREQNKLVDKKRSIQDTYNGLYEQMQDLQRNVRDRQKVKEENIQQIRQAELKLAELTKEKELIRNKIREVYHQEVPKRILDLTEINIDELRDSIAAIDRSINRIGPINMAVAEEYKAESERYEFLKKQFDDLQESEQNLKQSIEKIDTEARKKFSKTFEQVAENFKTTYKLFFDGGEAHVRLVGSDDPLEAEIEIIARPPGKRTQTIRMLSAGEKALTAISLLFAIYLVKPSPFCILDEVDAPLDDSNITRFTKVLRQFSENTQFIVITHNKLTMEEADYLYGVTQEEEGVSKIVSVKFKNEGQPLQAVTSDIPGN